MEFGPKPFPFHPSPDPDPEPNMPPTATTPTPTDCLPVPVPFPIPPPTPPVLVPTPPLPLPMPNCLTPALAPLENCPSELGEVCVRAWVLLLLYIGLATVVAAEVAVDAIRVVEVSDICLCMYV